MGSRRASDAESRETDRARRERDSYRRSFALKMGRYTRAERDSWASYKVIGYRVTGKETFFDGPSPGKH
jgi:hypothetical protein